MAALIRMSTLFYTFAFLTLTGLTLAQQQLLSKACIDMDDAKVLSKITTCIARDHPEYFLTVLTKMGNMASMESLDFVCSNQGMFAVMEQCFMQLLESCLPPPIAGQMATLMPSEKTVTRGISFICTHRKDFENECVVNKISGLSQCFNQKMKAFSQGTSAYGFNVQERLCTALHTEEQCLAAMLSECPAAVRSNLMTALLAFFPGENCHITMPVTDNILKFQSNDQY